MKTKPVSELFIEDREIDQEYSNWADNMEALASFIVDYEYLKNKQSYSQENIARKAGTTQSAISRLVRMKGKPTYDLLQRVSSAVDGKLFISPLGEFTTTLNYEFHDRAISFAEKEGVEVSTLLRRILNEYFDNEKVIEDVHVCKCQKNVFVGSSNEGNELSEQQLIASYEIESNGTIKFRENFEDDNGFDDQEREVG